jgi:glycosyltransferase involved in cell wall biosynthesis
MYNHQEGFQFVSSRRAARKQQNQFPTRSRCCIPPVTAPSVEQRQTIVLRDAESPHRSSTQKFYGLRDAISWPRKSTGRKPRTVPSDRRLLVVTESLGVGGTESHLIRLLSRLAAAGWSVAVFCLTERGERAEQVENAGVEVFAAPPLAKRKGLLLRYPAHIALASNKLYGLMRRWRPNIAHFYLPGPYLVGTPVAIAARTPIKIMSRRSLSDYQRNWPTVARLERRLHVKMDAVIGNSRAVVRELLAEGVPQAKVRLIYNGIDVLQPLPDRNEARRALGLDDDTLVGVVVANLIPYKAHRDLIRGLSHVARNLTMPLRILCAGRDHGLRSELEALAAARGITENIQFLGQRSDVSRLLAAADFGLLTPCGNEGFSNVILESMAAGLAMIVTDVGGNAEAVVDAETGFVVPPRNPEAIGDAILCLARDPEQRERLGAAARKRVEETFSLDQCVQAHAELYQEMLDKAEVRRIAAE